MRHWHFRLPLVLTFGLGLTLALLGLMSYLSSGAPPAYAADLTVCLAGPPTCTYTNVQAAVDAAAPGDVIKVASGTYTGVSVRAGVTQVVYLNKSVTLRGGYTPAFTDPPDPQANPTTLDAQGQGRVIYITRTISSTIEGFRITGGHTTNPYIMFYAGGGGIQVFSAIATLSNNEVFSNTAYVGGGIYIYSSTATLNGNKITNNTANYGGGGVTIETSPATLKNNDIRANTAPHGGGLYLAGDQSTLEGNNIVANRAITNGGGLFLDMSNAFLSGNVISGNIVTSNYYGFGGGISAMTSTGTFSQNLFFNNRAYVGGGLYLRGSHSTLHKNRVMSNTADYGGGVTLEGSDGLWSNNVVANNQASEMGSGIYMVASSPQLFHTTIAHNEGGDGSGIILQGWSGNPSRPVLTNTIIANHTVGITGTADTTFTLINILNSGNLIDGGGSGFITATQVYTGNPAFVDPAKGDYHIGSTSAAIDKGINAGIASDIDGDIRPQGTGYDLGADEYFLVTPLLSISKIGPVTSTVNVPITYTLTITNEGGLTATNLVVTDVIPIGASYISGGIKVGNTVSWALPNLAANGGITQTIFVVTTTQTITNSDYQVIASAGYSATGKLVVVTVITDTPISGLAVVNNSPTVLGNPTILTATITTGDYVTYNWAFGDGNSGNGSVISYTYPAVGAYTAVVTATNGNSVMTTTNTVTITGIPDLTISKSGLVTATTGTPITYTLTITNSGSLTATNLIITDVIPIGANYISGGTKVGNVVSWTVPSLAANGGTTQTTFVVTATQTITNSDYGVQAYGGYTAQGSGTVVTLISGTSQTKTFLPMILKP